MILSECPTNVFMGKEYTKRYIDFSAEDQAQDTRTWGVQVVIVRDGMMFVRPDDDAADRIEAHVISDRVVFPEARPRLNCSGGGKKEHETLKGCALREMEAELGIKGEGTLIVLKRLPIMACGQIREVDGQPKGALLGVIPAVYEPTEAEWKQLIGREGAMVVPIDEMLEWADWDDELALRPTFRTVLHVAKLWRDNTSGVMDSFVGGLNLLIVKAMREECFQENVPLKEGIFA